MTTSNKRLLNMNKKKPNWLPFYQFTYLLKSIKWRKNASFWLIEMKFFGRKTEGCFGRKNKKSYKDNSSSIDEQLVNVGLLWQVENSLKKTPFSLIKRTFILSHQSFSHFQQNVQFLLGVFSCFDQLHKWSIEKKFSSGILYTLNTKVTIYDISFTPHIKWNKKRVRQT